MDKLQVGLKVLGLKGRPTLAAIRSQYLRLARTHHPDMIGGDSEKMKQINTAYELLQANSSHFPSQEGGGDNITAQQSVNNNNKTPRKPTATSSYYEPMNHTAGYTISPEEQAHPSSHPYSYTPDAKSGRVYNMMDDVALYHAVRAGNSTKQVARSFGLSEEDVISRVSHAQHKRRVRLYHKSDQKYRGKTYHEGRPAMHHRSKDDLFT
eukprot:PhF_6_TR19506/c1_g1_i1/m.28487